ncbi:MAG: RNA polymerase subunit sigma-24 [Flammeovirgaceae bacterium]|nr:RNA polymerase subunit sigma-24 [Flammeovirgaceae bacterium]MBR06451.1 RNA polymerase subunit sigma-24 [Rickettsiales bacterium]
MEEVKRQFSDKALKDFKLIDRATLENDESAFAELMSRYKKPVYHMILKMVRNVDDAEDLTIEAFAKAFKNLARFKKDYTFSTWLFRIATNNAIDFIRKKKLETYSLNTSFTDDSGESVNIDVEDGDRTPDEEAINTQKIELVRMFVTKLPAKYQRLVKLRYFDELSYEEIAIELDAPLGTVKAQLHRARELMYELVKDKKKHI